MNNNKYTINNIEIFFSGVDNYVSKAVLRCTLLFSLSFSRRYFSDPTIFKFFLEKLIT